MRLRAAFMLCLGALVLLTGGCGDNAGRREKQGNTQEHGNAEEHGNTEGHENVEEHGNKEGQGNAGEAALAASPGAETEDEKEERMELSRNTFCEEATAHSNMSEEDAGTMYRKVEDSGILDGEYMRLTGAVFNDYDENGETDMIVCLYEDKEDNNGYVDGCLYLFMNDEEPLYIYDDFCCYYFGFIFGDFGADIDNDGNTEIIFCVQGTGNGGAGDCQKFVVKHRDGKAERMELPSDFSGEYDYDCGINVEIKRDADSGAYNIYCPYLDETIVMKTQGEEEERRDRDSGGNCRGYFALEMAGLVGGQRLAGYEYLFAGAIVEGLGNAVFLFDWDENGRACVSGWYVEDFEGNIYVPDGGILKKIPEDERLFDESETGREVKAYEEFLRGNREAVIMPGLYTDTSYRGMFLTEAEDGSKWKKGFSLEELIVGILNEIIQDRWQRNITDVQYALIDCGSDGRKQLALRAYGLSIYMPNDNSSLTMVFDYKDGKVSMVYAADAWARSYNEVYKNGCAAGEGSGGAACHYVWEGMIGADGIYRESFGCHIETGQGLYEMSSYHDFWGTNNSKSFPAEFYEYTINDKTIYAYYITDDAAEEEKQLVLDYIEDNEKLMGVDFLTDDEAWGLVEKNRKTLKITDEMYEEENKIDWRVLVD